MSTKRERALFVMQNVMAMAARMANEGRIERIRVELSLEEITTIVAALRTPELIEEVLTDMEVGAAMGFAIDHETVGRWAITIRTAQESK